MRFRVGPGRGPATAASAMVATSQPSATLAGIDILKRGGNAVDAAIAAAGVLCVSEPMSTGIGGDAFAIVADHAGVHGMDAGGPAPRTAPTRPVATAGGASCVVPGAVAGWDALSRRFGRLGLDTVLVPAIDLATSGVAAGYHCAHAWQRAARAPAAFGSPPDVGETFSLPDLADTLRHLAAHGPDGLYRGRVARAIASVSWLDEEDLASYSGARWVTPMSTDYRGVEVLELPPPTQGVAALEGLALLRSLTPTLRNQVRATALALEDAFAHVRDGADVTGLLTEDHLARRLASPEVLQPESHGGTVYLCCVDDDGMAVSFIQSLFEHFGSGVVAPGTGIVLNNRAACFEIAGEVEAGRRPYNTIIPGLLLESGRVRGPFGVMGAFIQAQAHLQLVSAMLDDGLDPQAALDRPRFRLDHGRVRLEEGLWRHSDELHTAGWAVVEDLDRFNFGGGQVIELRDDRIFAGSDPRKDGFAAGF